MTRRKDTDDTESDTMTDEDNHPDAIDPVTDHATVTETTEKQFGERGDLTWTKEDVETDTEEMVTERDVTIFGFCNCGEQLADATKAYRCCSCDDIACTECRINVARYNYCPRCIREQYGITRELYYTLYLTDLGLYNPGDAAFDATIDGDLIDIQIDDAATAMIDRGLVHTRDTSDTATAIGDDDQLTADGKQALHMGDQVYGDDPDVQKVKEQAEILRAARHGG